MTDDQTVIVTVSPEDDAVAVEVAPSEVEQISVEVLPADGGVVVTGDLNVDLTSTNALIEATNTALAEPLHVIVDSSAAAAGLTDAELRAAPVVVHLDEAIQGQSDGLTDAQLRASAVEVHVANQAPATDVSGLATSAGQDTAHLDQLALLDRLAAGLGVTVTNPSDTSSLATEASLAGILGTVGSDENGTLAQLLYNLVSQLAGVYQFTQETSAALQQFTVIDPSSGGPSNAGSLLARLVVAAEGQSGVVIHTETSEALGPYERFYGPARVAPAGAAYLTVQVLSIGAGCSIEVQHNDFIPELNPDDYGVGFWTVRVGPDAGFVNEVDSNVPLTVTVRRTGTWYRVVQTNNSDIAQTYNRVNSAFTGA